MVHLLKNTLKQVSRFFSLAGLLVVGAQVPSYAQQPAATPAEGEAWVLPNAPAAQVYKDDYYLGNPDAKIVVIEYASLTCPHCANFNTNIFPSLKKDFIDTGKILYVYRDFPLDQYAYQAALIAQCAPRERYFGIIDQLYGNQKAWVTAENPATALESFAKTVGLNAEQLQQCYNNQTLIDRVIRLYNEAVNVYQIQSTPSIIVNGQLQKNIRGYEDLQKYLNSLTN